MEQDYLDRLYQEAFQDFEGAVPDEAWDHVRQSLPDKNRRRWLLWLLWLGLISAGGYYYAQYLTPLAQEQQIQDITGRPSIHADLPALPPNQKLSPEMPALAFNSLSSTRDTASITSVEGVLNLVSNVVDTVDDLALYPFLSQETNSPALSQLDSQFQTSFPISSIVADSSLIFSQSLPRSPLLKWYAGVGGYQRYHQFLPDVTDQQLVSFLDLPNNLSVQRIGVKVQIGVIYALTPKWDVFAEVNGNWDRQELTYQLAHVESYKVTAGKDLTTGLRIAPVWNEPIPQTLTLVNLNMSLVGGLRHQTQLGTWDIGIGVQQALASPELRGAEQPPFEALQTTGYFVQVGFALNLWNRNKVRWSIRPEGTYQLRPWVFDRAPFAARPYQVGVGIRYEW